MSNYPQPREELPLFRKRPTGEELKRDGIARAEAADQDLASLLRSQARMIAIENGRVTIDDVRDWADARGLKAPSPAFWGSIFKGRGWKIIGYERSRRREKHGHLQPVWALA